MAPSRPARPRRPGAPGPTRFGVKKRYHQGDHNGERGTKPCLNFPTRGMLKTPEINTSRPRPQSADSWDSPARLGLEPNHSLNPTPDPAALTQIRPRAPTPGIPDPARCPRAPRSPARPGTLDPSRPHLATADSSKQRISRSQDFRGALRPPPADLRSGASGSFGRGRGAHLSLLRPPRLCKLRSGMVRLAKTLALGLFPSFSLAKQWLLRIRCREDFTIRPLGSETRKPPLRFPAPPPLLAVPKMASLRPLTFIAAAPRPRPPRRRERGRARGRGLQETRRARPSRLLIGELREAGERPRRKLGKMFRGWAAVAPRTRARDQPCPPPPQPGLGVGVLC